MQQPVFRFDPRTARFPNCFIVFLQIYRWNIYCWIHIWKTKLSVHIYLYSAYTHRQNINNCGKLLQKTFKVAFPQAPKTQACIAGCGTFAHHIRIYYYILYMLSVCSTLKYYMFVLCSTCFWRKYDRGTYK